MDAGADASPRALRNHLRPWIPNPPAAALIKADDGIKFGARWKSHRGSLGGDRAHLRRPGPR